MISPFTFPVTSATFNFVSPAIQNILEAGLTFLTKACVIFGAITIFGVLTWYFTPEEQWLPHNRIIQALEI
jgi:translation initiation factor 5B